MDGYGGGPARGALGLRFLGSGSAFSPELGDTAACLLSGSRLVLLDCGETVFARLKSLPEYGACSELIVLLTHLHADHVGSLGTLVSHCRYVTGKRVTIVHPLDSAAILLDLMGVERSAYDFLRPEPGAAVGLGAGLAAEPLEVEHVPGMRCFGYFLSQGAERIWYGGDSRTMPEPVLAGLLAGRIGLVYQDAGGGEGEGQAHASLERIAELVPPDLRKKVFCVHLNPDDVVRARRLGFGTVEMAAG